MRMTIALATITAAILLASLGANSANPYEIAPTPAMVTCCTPTGECGEMTEDDCDALAEVSAEPIVPDAGSDNELHQCGSGPVMPLSDRPEAGLVLVETCSAPLANGRLWQSCLLVTIDACRSTNERTTALWPEVLDSERALPWARPPSVGAVMRVVLNGGMVVGAEEDGSCAL